MTRWPDAYAAKSCTAETALSRIHSGRRIFIGSACGEPQHLVRTLADHADAFTDLEIVRLLSLESAPLSLIANKSACEKFTIRSFYTGSLKSRQMFHQIRFVTPLNLSALPGLFSKGHIPLHAALIQVSPPDDFGWMSLGISVDITMAAVEHADVVIAQVNSAMPRVHGRAFIHVDDVDWFVHHEEPLISIPPIPEPPEAGRIADHIRSLIPDGATIQSSLGATPQAALRALADKNDLGIHTQILTPEVMELIARGVVTNRKKGLNNGKSIASGAVGNADLYAFIDDNPSIEFHPSDYVNHPAVISRHHRMISMNMVMEIDLTGQASADALPNNLHSGMTGIADFVRGAALSPEGKSILILTATRKNGTESRIVPELKRSAVVIQRSDVQYVVTEFGSVNLYGKTLQERAMALISIAHPDFREALFETAVATGLIGRDRNLNETLHGIYPEHLETLLEKNGHKIIIRALKPSDERIIQEHYYNLDPADVESRFFQPKHHFVFRDLTGTLDIDYQRNMTLIALLKPTDASGESVIGVAGYRQDPSNDMAEIALSVLRPWQRKGIGKALMWELVAAAREGGVRGFTALTVAGNRSMIHLFRTLPFAVHQSFEDGVYEMSCRFDKLKIASE